MNLSDFISRIESGKIGNPNGRNGSIHIDIISPTLSDERHYSVIVEPIVDEGCDMSVYVRDKIPEAGNPIVSYFKKLAERYLHR